MPYSVKHDSMDVARSMVMDHARAARQSVRALLQSDADHDWPRLRAAVERYIQLQSAADVLNGVATVAVPPKAEPESARDERAAQHAALAASLRPIRRPLTGRRPPPDRLPVTAYDPRFEFVGESVVRLRFQSRNVVGRAPREPLTARRIDCAPRQRPPQRAGQSTRALRR